MILKAYKYRLYPTTEQAEFLNKTFGCCRWIYNRAVARVKPENDRYREEYKQWKENGGPEPVRPKISQIIKELNQEIKHLKKAEETAWLAEAPSIPILASLRNYDTAWSNYFRGLKDGTIKAKKDMAINKHNKKGLPTDGKFWNYINDLGKPKFKDKAGHQSFQFHQGYRVHFTKGTIDMPKLKGVKTVFHRTYEGISKTCTVSRTPSGKYFISILVETPGELPELKPIRPETSIGIHFGITDMATTKKEIVIQTNRKLRDNLTKLKTLYKLASKKTKGSSNQKKAYQKVAKLYERITNQRNYILHALSNQIVRNDEVDTICLENWNKIEMMGDSRFAQGISDVSWGRAMNFIEYKAKWAGKNVLKIDRFDPSAKTCSHCQHVNDWVELKHRTWECTKCGTHHHRGKNSARNIERMALSQVSKK
jgi:putative transposase